MATSRTAVVAPGHQAQTNRQQSLQQQQQQAQIPHGTKRPADGGLENEQRLSKRFDLLNLVDPNGTRLYIPVSGSSDSPLPSSTIPARPIAPAASKKDAKKKKPRPLPADDDMQVEDTPNRIYIHDLAAELSDIESDEENPIFLSDIEKHLSKIPKHVLIGPEPKPTEHNQIVLYNVPSSLSIPEEQDNVRKAIVEARARMRDNQASGVAEPESVNGVSGGEKLVEGYSQPGREEDMGDMDDPDAMEIDDL